MNPPQPGPLPTRALPEWLSLAGGVAIVTGGGTHLGLAMAMQKHGRLDVMVCNAGGGVGTAMAPHIPVADLQATLHQNVTTTLVCAQSAARAMMARKRGAIITIGSLHATLGSDPRLYAPGYRRSTQSYHAAKGAILNLTRALACELAQYDITVNCLSPGQIPKPELNAFTRENFRNMVPLGRLGEPRDLKGAVALFASPAGRWITGQNLTVDGGSDRRQPISADLRELGGGQQAAAATWPFDQHTRSRLRHDVAVGATDRSAADMVDTVTDVQGRLLGNEKRLQENQNTHDSLAMTEKR